jgi:hypothetical protein
MNKSLNNYIKELPFYVRKEIFYFIIPNPLNIIFKRNNKQNITTFQTRLNISNKYEVALLEDSIDYYDNGAINPNQLYLFRIPKKNGRHRYYITEMIWYQVEAEDYIEVYRIHYIAQHKYISKYVGKNIKYAHLLLFTDKNILEEDINKYLMYINK